MTDASAPIVFYEDGYNLFRRENAHFQRIERSDCIRWFDIQQSENEPREHDLGWQAAMTAWLVVLMLCWRHIPRFRLLLYVVSLPVVHWCSEQGSPVFYTPVL